MNFALTWDLRWRKESRFGWLTYTMKLEQDINKLTSYYCRYGLLLIYRLKITPGREGKANNLPLWLVFNTITSIIANNKNLKEERVVATLGVFWGDLSGKTPLGKKLKKELFYIMMKMLRCFLLLTNWSWKTNNNPPMKRNLEVTLGVGDRAILTTCKKKVALRRN